jgi:hypothetical protein
MANGNELTLRRVVVALDAAADFAPAIELAGLVAAAWGAGLCGLFAEDERLHRLAALPFAQQLDPATALRSPMNPTDLRSELAALAQRMRQALKQVADRHGLACSFESITTPVGPDRAVIDQDELLVVGVAGRPMAHQIRLESAWEGIVGDLRRRLLLVGRQTQPRAPVVVLYGPGGNARSVLQAGIRIAASTAARLVIAVTRETAEADRDAAEAAARRAGVVANVVLLPALSPVALAGAIGAPIDLLVIAGDSIAAREDMAGLLRSTSGAVLIV